jgi:predicted nucleotidyltransferase
MVQLIDMFGKKALMNILTLFLRNPKVELSQKDIMKKTGAAKASLTKWLGFLVKENMLKMKAIGKNKLYHLNMENSVAKQMKILINLMELYELKALSKKYRVDIYLYGSCARGEDYEDSDVDVLVIGRMPKEQIMKDIRKISEKTKRSIIPMILSPVDWSALSKKDPAFYERVEKDMVKI